eukprot:CAMPEP_0204535942 /NCGR_PEP_ID=MMETSP0661-20131031/14079_1 /ASSEMBLY_ACC=CAM_ASM_000606 /TAXON_ID=109239 /ORGANISM="Alexandrium margalefi, Strain AMGDE01CS-322" /LENGTH=91 /DNA_ID=CAMNT_0051542449 /DNA_START=60 /DNA_END=332 /DNA_ORIENTATION=+
MAFQALDAQGRGRLGLLEMRRFADFCGFDGTTLDWAAEYASMCRERRCREEDGLGLQDFQQLVDDMDGKGYCTDCELTGLLEELRSEVVSR